MKPLRWPCAIIFIVVGASQTSAQDTHVLPVSGNSYQGSGWLIAQALGTQEKQDKAPPEKAPEEKAPNTLAAPAQTPETDAFAQAPTAGGEAPTGNNPRMIGDKPGQFVLQTVTVPSIQTITQLVPVQQQIGTDSFGHPIFRIVLVPTTVQVQTHVTTVVRVPVPASAVGFKVADNQSPQPGDRAFLTYNYFNNVHGPNGDFPAARTDLHGEVLGFEKTILDGKASVGVRVPLFQQEGDGSFGQQGLGDLGLLFNYAFYHDQSTGNVLSGGMLLTLPTGPAVDTIAGNIHATVLQPFGGYRWNHDQFYVLGFTSLAIPTDSRDVTSLFNDVGLGYWLYRASQERPISAVIPTMEAHLTTPLNHRNSTDPVSGFDLLTLTTGVHVGLFNRSMLTLGVVTPVTGPRPCNVEAVAQFNFRF